MNMQDFYRRLSVKPQQPHQRHLAGLTRVSRSQILHATNEFVWFVWDADTPGA